MKMRALFSATSYYYVISFNVPKIPNRPSTQHPRIAVRSLAICAAGQLTHLARTTSYSVVAMHSLLTGEQLTRAFANTDGVTKVVLATNIAESGITIPDVVFVIDAGRVKENRLDELTAVAGESLFGTGRRRGKVGRTIRGGRGILESLEAPSMAGLRRKLIGCSKCST